MTLSFPDHQTQDIVLLGVPRVGEKVRLRNGTYARSLVVLDVLWIEGARRGEEPSVLVFVQPLEET